MTQEPEAVFHGCHCGRLINGVFTHCPYEKDAGFNSHGGKRIVCDRYHLERCFDFGDNPDGTSQTCRVSYCHDDHRPKPLFNGQYCGQAVNGEFCRCPYQTIKFRAFSNVGGTAQDYCTMYNIYLNYDFKSPHDDTLLIIVRSEQCVGYEEAKITEERK